MNKFNFHIPVNIVFGCGRINEISEHIRLNNILIVTDKTINLKTEIVKIILAHLSDKNIFVFDEVEENPSFETIECGAKLAKKEEIELVIGVGGGSSLDAAKGIAIRTVNNSTIKQIVSNGVSLSKALPIICIPTTSGTGSEVTPFAVFTDEETHLKHGFSDPLIFPKVSILDPELTYSMPESIIVNTGLDALSHSIEAYLSNLSNEVNDAIALESINTVADNLYKAKEKNKEAMSEMAYAGMLGGIAISHAGTILPHIMGYPLTSFHDLPHGKASILLQIPFIKYLKENNLLKEKSVKIEQIFERYNGLKGFIKSFDFSLNLSDYGVKSSMIRKYAKQTITKSDVKITPGDISTESIIDIYKSTL